MPPRTSSVDAQAIAFGHLGQVVGVDGDAEDLRLQSPSSVKRGTSSRSQVASMHGGRARGVKRVGVQDDVEPRDIAASGVASQLGDIVRECGRHELSPASRPNNRRWRITCEQAGEGLTEGLRQAADLGDIRQMSETPAQMVEFRLAGGLFQSVVDASSTVSGPVSPAGKCRWIAPRPQDASAPGDSSPVGR